MSTQYAQTRDTVFWNDVTDENTVTAGTSPYVIAVYDLLGRAATRGYLINDGPGDIWVEQAQDNNSPGVYGGMKTLKSGEILRLEGAITFLLRLTHSGVDAAFRFGAC
jgi:hypothetical protein